MSAFKIRASVKVIADTRREGNNNIWSCSSYTGYWSLTKGKYLAHICPITPFLYTLWLLHTCIFLSIPYVWQQQHWASLCAELSCAWGPSLPSFLLADTHTQCCHSSHLWINKVLSLQVCWGAGKCGGKGYSVPPPQVSELTRWTTGVGAGVGGHRVVTWTRCSHLLNIYQSVYCEEYLDL